LGKYFLKTRKHFNFFNEKQKSEKKNVMIKNLLEEWLRGYLINTFLVNRNEIVSSAI